MHAYLIEDFVGISVDYATCYRISTISTKDFFIYLLVDLQDFIADIFNREALSRIYFKLYE